MSELLKMRQGRTPRDIREEIADLLEMTEEERSFLNTVSLTYLISRLIDYTNTLEKALHKKQII
jgi:hypothetical protein